MNHLSGPINKWSSVEEFLKNSSVSAVTGTISTDEIAGINPDRHETAFARASAWTNDGPN